MRPAADRPSFVPPTSSTIRSGGNDTTIVVTDAAPLRWGRVREIWCRDDTPMIAVGVADHGERNFSYRSGRIFPISELLSGSGVQ